MAEARKTFSITFNKGIDKASFPFEGDPSRALDALNYVYRDGKLQKRHGINQILQTNTVRYVDFATLTLKTNTDSINGIWRFLAEDGQYHTVVHAGKLLFELQEEGGVFSLDLLHTGYFQPAGAIPGHAHTYPRCYELVDGKTVALIGNNSLYVLGGIDFLRVRFKPNESNATVAAVYNDEDTYIPTTSISITYRNAVASGRASLDQVNLMSMWRKNKLLSGVGVDEDAPIVYGSTAYGYVYQLDSPIVCGADEDIANVRVKIERRRY